ncbi:MAG: hypothetical protein ACXU8S_17665 [Phenylobacterium sp.]
MQLADRSRLLRAAAQPMVRRMLRRRAPLAASVLVLALSACGIDVRADAAQGIARFLDAVRRDDHQAFEKAIDRPALRADLRDQLADLGRARDIDIEGGPSEFALDRMITPEAFRLVSARTGEPMPMAPSAAQVALLMTVKDKSHVCLGDAAGQRCALAFAKRGGAWRLTGMRATELKVVALPPPPAPKQR